MARWLVLSEIVAMPRLHNVRMKTIPWRPYFTEVAAPSQVNLASAARSAGLAPAELTLLNLGFRRGMTAPNGPHRVLVRAEHAGRLGRELSQVRPVRLVERRRYRIRRGDTPRRDRPRPRDHREDPDGGQPAGLASHSRRPGPDDPRVRPRLLGARGGWCAGCMS